MDPLQHLGAAALFWFGIHAFISGGNLRTAIAARIGEKGFRGFFSLLSAIGLAWLIYAYLGAPEVPLWRTTTGARHLAMSVMLVAFVFLVLAFTTPNPGAVGQERLIERDPIGIQKVTRHPFLWAVVLWATVHMLARGDVAAVYFFGSFLATALVGTAQIDAKRARARPEAAAAYAAKTSNLPFLALIQGRARVSLKEIGYAKMAAGVAIYLVALYIHFGLLGPKTG
ncbi:MAG: NnrU family protein [Alphaproteobacteria bacterium]|nr:NnrU family protein [Alphaproteobacteria bacterium]